MNMKINKIAYVACIAKNVYVMEKKTGSASQFKCEWAIIPFLSTVRAPSEHDSMCRRTRGGEGGGG
jgi:hypothetical protein